MQPPLSLHGEGVIPLRNEQRRISALIWLRGIKLCPGSEPHPGGQHTVLYPLISLIVFPGALQSAYAACEELAARSITYLFKPNILTLPIYICSDFEVSVSVAWEKIKGDNDAGRQEGGELWLQEGSAKAAAAKAAAAAAASTPELVSPLPSVVASQVEFIKHTLRAQNAHVRSLPFTFYSCLRIQLVLCNRCSGCRVTATERGSSAITACSAPNCVFIMYRLRFFVFNAALITGTPQSASAMLNSMR